MISIPKIASSIVPFFYVSSGWLGLDMGAHWFLSRGGRKAVSLKGGFVI